MFMRGDLNYCARCGSPLALRGDAEPFPVLVCTNTACGRVTYRNAKPCAGVLVERDQQLLLVQRAIEPFAGRWDIPGGFCQEWEHPTECAVREVREETGLAVELTALLGIFVDTYDSAGYNTLNIYYRAQVVGGAPQPADDAAALRWFACDELPDNIAFPDHERHVLALWRSELLRVPHPTPEPYLASFVSPQARQHADPTIQS